MLQWRKKGVIFLKYYEKVNGHLTRESAEELLCDVTANFAADGIYFTKEENNLALQVLLGEISEADAKYLILQRVCGNNV